MLLLLTFLFLYNYEVLGRDRWTPDQANNWFNSQKYIMGSEYMTSNAVNQIEMFQAETFDADLIDKELEVYGKLGMNTIRVFMHDVPYTIDPAGFKSRLTTLVEIANKYGIRPTLLFFTPSEIANPVPGKQPKPVSGVVSSGKEFECVRQNHIDL